MAYVIWTTENDSTGETRTERYDGRYEDLSEAGVFDARPGETIVQMTDYPDVSLGQRLCGWIFGK